jgi:hypothetical protein
VVKGPKQPPGQYPEPPDPEAMAQTTPKGVRSYTDLNTHQMVFELQGTVHEMKQAVASLDRNVERQFLDIKERLNEHQKSLRWIERAIWLVTGGAIVIGAVVGLVSEIGIAKIAALFGK